MLLTYANNNRIFPKGLFENRSFEFVYYRNIIRILSGQEGQGIKYADDDDYGKKRKEKKIYFKN